MYKCFIDYINTINTYLVELVEVDSQNNVLNCLEKCETDNVDDAVDICLDIQDKYKGVTFYTESELFDSVILTRARYNQKILHRYIH